MLVDYHIHTKLCGHARGDMEEYVREAIRKGFDEIGFSDHLPLLNKVDPYLTMGWDQFPRYVEEVNRLAWKYSDTIRIRLGVEADYMPGLEDELGQMLERYDFDYVYGSVHNIGDWGFDDSREKDRWESCDVTKTYQEYFDLVKRAVRSGLFDILAHLDLVKKFGYRPEEDHSPLVDQTLDVIAETGTAVELNTSGLRKPVGEVYPDLKAVEGCIERGIPLTFGSDAHRPEEVGLHIPEYIEKLQTLGLKGIALFSKRGRRDAPLEELPRTCVTQGYNDRTVRLTLSERERIRKSAEFDRAFEEGKKIYGDNLGLVWRQNDLEVSRLGVVVTRNIRKATRRNRWKRLLREAFRQNKMRIKEGVDLVLIARSEAIPSFSEVEAEFLRLSQRAGILEGDGPVR